MLFDLDADPNQLTNLADNDEVAGKSNATDALDACRRRLNEWMLAERDQSRPAFVQDMQLSGLQLVIYWLTTLGLLMALDLLALGLLMASLC